MKRLIIVAFALVASYLVVSTVPVTAASAELAVGSEHTTASDFQGGTLSAVNVAGTGSSASVTWPASSSDGFDDGALAGWTELEGTWSETGGTLHGDSGNQDLQWTGAGEVGPEFTATADLQPDIDSPDSTANPGVAFLSQGEDNFYAVRFQDNTSISLISAVGGSYSFEDSISGSFDMTHWYTIKIAYSDGVTTATVTDQTTGQEWTLSHTFSPEADFGTETGYLGALSFSGAAVDSRWDNYQVNNENDGRYISANHSVSNAVEGWTNLTLENATATVELQVPHPDGQTTVTSKNYSTTGNHTFDLPDSIDSLKSGTLKVSFKKTGSNPTAQLHDEGILFEPHSPTVNNASLSPGDRAKLTEQTVTLSANVSDPDFDNGDTVTVDFVVDGDVVGTETRSSNGTVSTTIGSPDGGEHAWQVEITDDHGGVASSQTKTFLVPSTIHVRPVNHPNELINGSNITVTARFFSGELVFERQTSNGVINLTNLPVDRTYVLVIDTENYYRRTVIITSLYEQDSAYLLNRSHEAFYTEFVLNDLTGEFSGSNQDTKLYIERAINTSSGPEWITVSGDYFGAEGRFEDNLQRNERYRIRIVSDSSSRVLGEYTASREGTVEFDVGEVRWNVTEPESIQYAASFHNLTDEGEPRNGVVHFQFLDPAETTTRLHVVVHEQGNASNELMNTNFTEGVGEFSLNETIEGEQMTKQWVVDWRAYNASGAVVASSSNPVTGQRHRVENPFGEKWTPVVLTTLFLFVGTMFGGRLSSLGALAVTGIAGVTWWMGWFAASGGVVVFAGLVGVAFAVGGGGRR